MHPCGVYLGGCICMCWVCCGYYHPWDEPVPTLVMMDVDGSGPGLEAMVGVIYTGARMINDIGMCLNT